MTAAEAFATFVGRVFVPLEARRFAMLASSRKGQRRILNGLSHEFDASLRFEAIRDRDNDYLWSHKCFVFHSALNFGVESPNVRDAYKQLSLYDSWLILLEDASAGIYRPEARWDDEKLIAR
jgi:hypothetical protein